VKGFIDQGAEAEGGEDAMTQDYDALAAYIRVLAESADVTHHTEDRTKYQSHLAAAARIFAALHGSPTDDEVRRLIEEERRNYGWAFLSGNEGDRAEAAFTAFAEAIERGLSKA